MSVLSRKIALTQAVRSMKYLFPNEYHFYPNSWVIPAQLDEFREHIILMSQNKQHTSLTTAFSLKKKNLYYIVKPDDGKIFF